MLINSTKLKPETSDRADNPAKVVFLHGLFGRGKNFTRIATALLPEAEVLLVDLPNHGASDWTTTLSYEEMADAVADHLREDFAKDGPVSVVGHSMGGKVAMVLALHHPELVDKLAVIDISPTSKESSRGQFVHLLGALKTVNLEALKSRAEASTQLKELIPEDSVRGFLLQNLIRDGDGFKWEPNLALLYDELETIMDFPYMVGFHFDGPVLWIGGANSNYVTDEDEPIMRALFSETERVTIADAGHWVHAEQPDRVISLLRAHLLND